MHRKELNEIGTEDIQDVISRSPSWMLQWGMLLVLFVFATLLGASWFIKYPDVVKASIEVTTEPSPVSLVSRAPGRLKLLKKNRTHLKEGDLIGYIQSDVLPEAVYQIDEIIEEYQSDNDLSQFYLGLSQLDNAGELQKHVKTVEHLAQSLLLFKRTKVYEQKSSHFENQIHSYHKLNLRLQTQLDLHKQETEIINQSFSEDSILYAQGLLSTNEFNQSRSAVLAQLRGAKSIEYSIISNELEIEALQNRVIETGIAKAKEMRTLAASLSDAIAELLVNVGTWKENHLFKSPIGGQLVYLSILEDEQFVDVGPLFTIMPESGLLIAKGELSIEQGGKVREGQSVKIRLNDYLEGRFGTISGSVQSISRRHREDQYQLIIKLPEGLRNSVNSKQEIEPFISGDVEIITKDLRLLERFFYKFSPPFK